MAPALALAGALSSATARADGTHESTEAARLDGAAEDPGVPTPPPPAPPPVDRQRPSWNGKGLLIGAGVAGGVGLALNAGRIGWHLATCHRRDDPLGYVGGCLVSTWGDVFLSIPSWFANMASIGLAGGGGALRGRYEAWEGRKRDSKKAIIAGATMVGVGATVYLASRLARFAAIGCVADSLGCYHGVYIGSTIGIQLGLSTAAAGAGILAFGAEYRRHRRKVQLQVSPTVSRTFTGLTVSGRF